MVLGSTSEFTLRCKENDRFESLQRGEKKNVDSQVLSRKCSSKVIDFMVV